MRFSVLISVALALCGLAGCPLSKSAEDGFATPGGDDDNGAGSGSGAPQSFCSSDLDCELASSSCCECPSFATSRFDPQNSGCTGIVCPNPPTCPANVRAACDSVKHQCAVACVEMTCATSCADGYAIDPGTGCLSCMCAMPALNGCSIDSDCVETREDCCGCARGGKDTAVLDSTRTTYDQMLSCPSNPQCPGLDTCDPASEPRCIQGSCVLTSDAVPTAECSGPGSCNGACIINRDPAATTHGVGVCVPP